MHGLIGEINILDVLKKCGVFFIISLILLAGCGYKNTAASFDSENEILKKNIREKVSAGDQVYVDFTCRLPDSSIVMTTDESTAQNVNEIKSGIYLPLKEYKSILLTAGSGKRGPDYGNLKSLENEILESLSTIITGMEYGVTKKLYLTADDNKNLSDEERFIQLSYRRKQEKKIRISIVAFKRQYGKDPVPGEIIKSDVLKGASFEILSCDEKEVVVRLKVDGKIRINTPAGKGTMYDAGNYIETVLDTEEGQLKRSGVLVGKIIDVDDELYKLDYLNPFGGETLTCEVTAAKEMNDDMK